MNHGSLRWIVNYKTKLVCSHRGPFSFQSLTNVVRQSGIKKQAAGALLGQCIISKEDINLENDCPVFIKRGKKSC